MEEIVDVYGARFDISLIGATRSAFADHVERTFEIYREEGSLDQALIEGDQALAGAHAKLVETLKGGVSEDQLREVQLELAKGDLTNSTHVMAKSRAILLWAAYERHNALTELSEDDQLPRKKKLLDDHWSSFHLQYFETAPSLTTYEEKLQIIDDYLASGKVIRLESRALTIKRLIGEVIAMEKKLGAAPTLERLKEIGEEIVADLRAPPRLLDIETAQRMQQRYNEQLALGYDAIGLGLESPANWTGIRRVTVKKDRYGTVYATSTVVEPLFKVPVVSYKKDLDSPANGWIERHEVIGIEESKTVGYRIAALRTDTAAQKAFDKMDIGDKQLHVSSLLTPAWFVTPDSELLRNQATLVRTHAANMIHTNVPVNRLGWVGRWPSDEINQKGFSEYDKLVNEETQALLEEIKELWNSGKTSNQFEVPAKLSLLNQQLGIAELWHCMSTKDRSSEKDGAAHFYIDQHYTGGAGEDSSEDRHRRAVNRRQSALIALSNPQRNTGFAGTKMKLWDPLVDYRSGFDAEYVLEQVKDAENKGALFRELTGADELGERRAKAVEAEVNRLGYEENALRGLLRDLAYDKAQTFKPMTHVKA